MAQKILYGLEVDSKGAVQGLKNATDAAENLNSQLGNTETQLNKVDNGVERTLQQTEVRIKAIDGAINILGGSVEVAVGALGLIGVPPEVQEEFQKAATSAIAFADGIKRVFDGYKSITEARKLRSTIVAAETTAEAANTTVTAANTAAQVANTGAIAANTTATVAQTVATAKANTVTSVLNKTQGGAVAVANQLKPLLAGINPLIAAGTALVTGAAIVWLNYRDGVESSAKAVKRNIELEKELFKVIGGAGRVEERQLKLLTDKVEQRGLETQAIEELKKAYPGFETFLTRENKLSEQGIAFLKTRIELRKAEAGLGAVSQKLIEEEVNLATKIAELREEYGFTTQAAKLVARERDESAKRTEILVQKEQEYSDAVNTALLALVPFNKELNRYAVANGPAAIDATDKQTISLSSYNVALKEANLRISERNKKLAEEVKLSLDVEGGLKTSEDIIKRASTIPSVLTGAATGARKAYATEALEFSAFLNDLQSDLIGFLESGAGEAIAQGLTTLSGLLSEYGNLQQEAINIQLDALQRGYERDLQLAGENVRLKEELTRNYEARELEITKTSLEQQKKLRRGQVIVSTAQAVMDAYASTASLPPPFGLIAGSILAAAYVGLGAKAIENINSTTLDSTGGTGASGFNNAGGGAGFSLPGGGGISTPTSGGNILPGLPGGGRIGNAPGMGTIAQAPVQAYVLASDVNNGQQAAAAIANRRRLAGG